jgi:hypothetical protein
MLDTILEDTKGNKKYVGDIVNTKVENILYFLKPTAIGKYGRKDVGKR